MKQLILASASPRRKQLLEMLGLEFTVVPSDIDETTTPGLPPAKQVEWLSLKKAESVGRQFHDAIVLAADTMVVMGRDIIGKPKEAKDAKEMLGKVSGSVHSIVTGFTLLDTKTGKSVTKSTETKIWFRRMTSEEIESYVEKQKPYDLAGGYAIHELASVFIKKIEGDCNGATGLSVFLLTPELKKFGIKVL